MDDQTFRLQRPTESQFATLDSGERLFASFWSHLDKLMEPSANKTLCYRHLEDAQHRFKKAVLELK